MERPQELQTLDSTRVRTGVRRSEVGDKDALALAKTGKTQVLQRRFGLVSMTGFSCGIMATWEGLLVTFALALKNGGPAGLLYGFLIAWFGTLSVFITMGELSSMIPTAGGQYHWVSILAPGKSKKFLSYVTGWITVVGWVAALTVDAYVTATLIQGLIAQDDSDYTAPGWQGTLIMWAVLVYCLAVNTILGEVLPVIEVFILILHVLGFFAIIIPLLYLAPHGKANYIFGTFFNGGGWKSQTLSFFIGLQGNAASFVGTDGAIHMSEEVRGASLNVARSMVISILINGVLAFGMLLAVLFSAGDIESFLEAPGFPFISIFASGVRSNAGATAMASLPLALTGLAAIGCMASASRMMWAFARDEGLPGWRRLTKVDRRTTVPTTAIIAVSILSALVCLINIGSSSVLNDVISLVLQGFYTSYFLAISLLLYRRLRGEIGDSEKDSNVTIQDVKSKRFNWGPWRIKGWVGTLNNMAACVYLVFIWIWSYWPSSLIVDAKNMNYSSLVLGVVVIASVLYYFITARKTYRGPIVEGN